MNKIIQQFEIWQTNLNPTQGSEQHGIRPCLIIQTNASGKKALTTIIIPLSSKRLENIYPFEVKIKPSKINGLQKLSKLKCEQIRVIDKSRLIKKIGFIDKSHHDNIFKALKVIFDINRDFN
ncbi:MAG: type II toxin-antitoxin system PemK/MazF family toxin [Parcubacteria group bacterium]